MTVLRELSVKFSSDRSTFHRGLQCLYVLSTLLHSTQEMFREPNLLLVEVKGRLAVQCWRISLSVVLS